MIKEKRILSYFLGWLIIGFLIMFVGINKIFASTYYMNYEYLQQYYDNRGSSLTNISTTWNESLQSYVSDDITTIANSYGAGLSFSSPIPLIKNHTYTLSIYFVEIENIALSSKSQVAVGTSLSDAKVNYANSNYYAETLYSKVNNNRVLQFTFKAGQNGGYIFIPWTTTTNTTQSYVFTEINIDDLGSEGISQSDIDNSLNNQTTIIENKFDDLEQSIVDSNKETQEVIKDQFNDCYQNLIPKSKLSLGSINLNNGELLPYTSRIRTDLIEVKPGITYNYSVNTNYLVEAVVYYDNEYVGVKTLNYSSGTLIFSDEVNQIRLRIKNINTDSLSSADIENVNLFFGSEEICTNKIDETNDKLDNINDALTDSSPTDMSGLGDSAGWLPAGPVDSILTLPLTMLNNLVNNLSNDSCQTAVLKLPYVETNINLPCIKTLYDKIGITGTLFQSAGLIASAFILFNYLLKLYQWVDATLTMRENTMPGYFDDNWGGGA